MSSRCSSAPVAASPASFQPSKATTTTESSSRGRSSGVDFGSITPASLRRSGSPAPVLRPDGGTGVPRAGDRPTPAGGYPGSVQSRIVSPDLRPDATAELTEMLGQRILVLDGAMGTAIQRDRPDEAGYRGERFADWHTDVQGNNDLLVLTQPELVAGIHREYLRAGADVIETNTFNANAVSLRDYDMSDLAYELNVAAARLARAVADEVTAGTPEKPRYVAGAVGPASRTASISPD